MRWLVVLLIAGSCKIEDNLVSCPDGIVCSAGDVCDEVHHICISPDQSTVCGGLDNGTPCVAGSIVGLCLDQVCLATVCGDSVVEMGEACDDGNHSNGDGCNSTCTSTEACGNGVLDPTFGETCDDGNRISGDGCSSTCAAEQATWTLEGIAPHGFATDHCVYDPVRHELLHVEEGVLWAWDGTRWSSRSADGPRGLQTSWYVVAFDSDRRTIVLIGADLQFATDLVWEWNGTAWMQHAVPGDPVLHSGAASYDPVAHRVLVLGRDASNAPAFYALESATGTFTPLTAPGSVNLANGYEMAYDAVRGVTVLAVGGVGAVSPTVTEWNGSQWSTPITAAMPAGYQFALGFDSREGAVIAVGGFGSSGTSAKVAKWTGSAWLDLAGEAMPAPRGRPELGYDTDRQRRIVMGGVDAGVNLDTLAEWNGTTWSSPAPASPPLFNLQLYAYDLERHRLVSWGGDFSGNQTWVWNGTSWRQLAGALPPSATGTIAYDPVRRGVVFTDQDKGTWLLGDETWTAIEPAGTGTGLSARAMTYDPIRRALVAIQGFTYVFPSEGDHWIDLGMVEAPAAFLGSSTTLAFDARNASVLGTTAAGQSFRLTGTTWSPAPSPGLSYTVVANARRGTVELISATGGVWEQDGVALLQRDPLPYPIDGVALYAPDTDELYVIGHLVPKAFLPGQLMLHRTLASATRLEACTPGVDADGDGLTGCADPECWWQCAPACPPYTSCP